MLEEPLLVLISVVEVLALTYMNCQAVVNFQRCYSNGSFSFSSESAAWRQAQKIGNESENAQDKYGHKYSSTRYDKPHINVYIYANGVVIAN